MIEKGLGRALVSLKEQANLLWCQHKDLLKYVCLYDSLIRSYLRLELIFFRDGLTIYDH